MRCVFLADPCYARRAHILRRHADPIERVSEKLQYTQTRPLVYVQGKFYYYFVTLATVNVIAIPKRRFRLDYNNYQHYALIVEKHQDAVVKRS